ncbi:MAG: sigma-54 dependent transcriptional regulator [Candidatus Pseudobacter hemicellulosilyticus]|uniref:Sigma-54 dependent transcriptional regulator n=1 Tax=Candidatus Pseudobacter hemicellulosilyticus TaxID=3121375 RepID=A0AAJ5WVS3_9BACT|nr:MAG: sigma-54 dependent transcriptional regulator [Pseudobacter sp.]
MGATILLVDDEDKLRGLLKRIISLEGYTVLEAASLNAGLQVLETNAVDVLLCDVKLPDGSGLDFVPLVRRRFPATEVILLTAYGNIPDGVQAMKHGAFDYITKGDDNDRILPLLSRALEKIRLQQRVARLEQQVDKRYGFSAILGQSPVIRNAVTLAQKVAPADTTVLLLGPTGSGKEVFAQAIHYGSKRADKPFLPLNCSAFSKELLESELFGHKAGAFTSAVKDKKGLIEEAHTGTLFLDEIGEMPLELQSKLLRVLETNEFIKVGDTRPTRVNVRIIAATNRNLQQEAEQGRFREDLFYRLNVFTIPLPALKERPEDIPLLADYYLQVFARKGDRRIDRLSPAFIQALQRHSWKGNVRELKNVLERAVLLAAGPELQVDDLPLELQTASTTAAPGSTAALSAFSLASMEKLHIQRVLNHTNGNKTEAARLLEIGLTTLYRKVEEYGLGTKD